MSKSRVKMWEFITRELAASFLLIKFYFIVHLILQKLKKNKRSNSYNEKGKGFSHF